MASQAQRPIQAPSSVSKGTEHGSIVLGDSPLTRDNGVVFKALDTVSVRQYLTSLVYQISGANIISASRISNGRIAAYLSSREAVIRAVENGLTHDGTFIELTPLVQPTTRLTLSNVYPEIPNAVLLVLAIKTHPCIMLYTASGSSRLHLISSCMFKCSIK